MSAAASSMMEVVPESQRLIALSLGKIAASRGQKGGINLHKNLLVATVLHKARTVFMMQHYSRQRAAAVSAVNGGAAMVGVAQPQVSQSTYVSPTTQAVATTTTTSQSSIHATSTSQNVEMRDDTTTASVSSSADEATDVCSSGDKSLRAAPLTGPHHSAATSSTPLQSAFPGGAEVSSVQMSETEDKENSPPPSSPLLPPPADGTVTVVAPSPISPECQARLQGGDSHKSDATRDYRSPFHPQSRGVSVSHSHDNGSTRAYVRSSTSFSSCVLKRRRLTDNENVSAPKVRILEIKVSLDKAAGGSTPEPMQLSDSPQISSLVNIFNISFANGLAGGASSVTHVQAGGDLSVRGKICHLSGPLGGHKKMSENLTCAKEISLAASLDSNLRQPMVLSV